MIRNDKIKEASPTAPLVKNTRGTASENASITIDDTIGFPKSQKK